MSSIRLFLVDDHALFREGLARLLGGDSEIELVGTSGSPGEALQPILEGRVDVLLLDYDLGPEPAVDFVALLKQRGFAGRILLVTAGLPDRDALQLIQAGVSGIFHKQHAPEDLRRSVREVHEGKVLIDQHYFMKLVQAAASDGLRPSILSDRERKILRYLVEGLANKEISAELRISESAVKASLQLLFSKTGVRTRSQLVRVALENYRDQI